MKKTSNNYVFYFSLMMMMMAVVMMMMMMVLTYDVDLHITLLSPRSKHLKGSRLTRIEVPNL